MKAYRAVRAAASTGVARPLKRDPRATTGRRAASLRARVADAQRRASAAASTPAVACVEWTDPLILSGHWVPEMVEIAGGRPVLVGKGEPSKKIGLDELIAARPEVLVFMPCGMDVVSGAREAMALSGHKGLLDMPAVRNGRVYVADGGAIFSRSGPRLIQGVEILGNILHPDLFEGGLPNGLAARIEFATGG